MNLVEKKNQDLNTIMNFINGHSTVNDIYSAFLKGPDPECGFMWTTTEWWTPKQADAIKLISVNVLNLGWDSSGFGLMMRAIENEIRKIPVATVVTVFDDDEGKCEDDPLAGKGSPYYKNNVENPEDVDNRLDNEMNFAKGYQQTSFGKSMDDNNKKALDVMVKKGADEAANYMMAQAGGDYARMRSMFG